MPSLAWLNSTKIFFVLRAVDIHLGDVGDAQNRLPHIFGDALQLGVIGAIAGDRVQQRVDVAELVVHVRPDEIRREFGANIADFLARLIEQVGHARGGVVSLKITCIAEKPGFV